MSGGFDVCLNERRVHFYSLDESDKLRNVYRGLVKECDINLAKKRCIDSGHKAIKILAGSPIFETDKNGENNAFLWRWRQAKECSAGREGKEME